MKYLAKIYFAKPLESTCIYALYSAMVKYKKSLYYASFAVYGIGAVVWPILYLNNQNVVYLLAEILLW